MGWNPFKTTKTYQYWNIVTADLVTDTLPDSFDEFATINDIVNNIDYWKSLEYLNTQGSTRNILRRNAGKFKRDAFFGGFSDVNIGTNFVPVNLVKNRINPSDPTRVNIKGSSVIPLNYTTWVENYLIETYQLHTVTINGAATLIFTIEGVNYSVDLSTANSTTNTVKYVNLTNNVEKTIDVPPEPIGAAYEVTYAINDVDANGALIPGQESETYLWQYWIGSGTYPELDTFTEIPDNDPTTFQIFPPIDIRKDGQSYPNNTPHADHAEYAESLGIDSKALIDAFTTDLDFLDHVTVNQGIKLRAKDKHSIKYCIDFIVKLNTLADTHTINGEQYAADSVYSRYFTSLTSVGTTVTSNELPTEIINVPGVDLVISHDEFAYGLKYSYIEIQNHSISDVENNSILKGLRDTPINVAEHGKVRDTVYKSIINNDYSALTAVTGITFVDSNVQTKLEVLFDALSTRNGNTITYYAIHKDGSIDSYTLVQPVLAHYVRDVQSGKHKLVYVDLESEDASVYLPLDYKILESYSGQAVASIVTSSLHLTMYYAYWEQKKVWDFGFITIVVLALVAIFAPYLFVEAAAWFSALSTTMQIVIIGATLASMGVFGEDAVIYGKLVLLAVGLYDPSFVLGTNMATASAALSVVDIMNTYNMQHLIDESEAIASDLAYSQAEWEKEMDLLDDELVAMGYYKRLRDQTYVQQGLVNMTKVDIHTPMSPQVYLQRNKKSVSARYTFQLQYNYA